MTDVVFSESGNLLTCHYSGPFVLASLVDAARHIVKVCRESKHTRVLVDLRFSRGKLGAVDGAALAQTAGVPWGAGAQLATLHRPDQALPDRFWETVTGSGGVEARTFTDVGRAYEWLETGHDPARVEV
jgi:hypothetical protein